MPPLDFARAPDDRFADLPAWPYAPRHAELAGFDGLRMHHVDEGPRGGDVILCLHGQPTWSYLYRKMIPVFVESGARVVAPDFFGFGRSDKPTDDAVYTWDFHRASLIAFIERLGLGRFTLVCQDWGGLLGLTLPLDMPDAIERLVVMNTTLAVGEPPGPGFLAWRQFVAGQPDFDVGELMRRAVPGLSDGEVEAYRAPFPDRAHRAGVRRFPMLVPVAPDMPGAETSRRAAAWWKESWRGPSFMAIGVQDPVLGMLAMERLRATIRGCPAPLVLEHAGHFVQEAGDQVARAALDHFAR
ncbi:MAG TPA: haloalkane dehalogenase [Kofleriaceae bacterium]|nr:haloalkane dehalogenase [Kofleriaceae bacterium]